MIIEYALIGLIIGCFSCLVLGVIIEAILTHRFRFPSIHFNKKEKKKKPIPKEIEEMPDFVQFEEKDAVPYEENMDLANLNLTEIVIRQTTKVNIFNNEN
jgi:hypothetical protein